ncbi:MAG: DUF4383 domain-containing protein [Actinobacteria bacterium]|nr:DUF4383 domain-containing protein [Actinomycetota bacterium]
MDRTTIQKAAMASGVVFLLVGIAGLIPWEDGYYDQLLDFSGEGADQLGFIGGNILEVAVHFLYAIAGFAMAKTVSSARTYFLGGGAIYLVIWLYGLVIDTTSSANVIGVNNAANWVHFALGIVMLGVGLTVGRDAERVGAS